MFGEPLLQVLRNAAQPVQFIEDVAYGFRDQGACRRGAHAASETFEQRHADQGFKIADSSAGGTNGEVVGLGGLCQVSGFDYGFEQLQCPDIQPVQCGKALFSHFGNARLLLLISVCAGQEI